MKLPSAAALAAALVLPAAPARAEVIDLSTMTCKKFIESSKDEIGMILTWLDGWYKGDQDDALIDTHEFEQNAKKLGAYCGANPNIGLITASRKVFEK
jgi:acid stress chaperone HdeB